MQITTRAAVFAAARASAPLLAAPSGTSTAGSDASTEQAQATTKQDDCTLPAPPANLSPDKLVGLLPRPGSAPPDPTEVERRLRKVDACARAAELKASGEETDSPATTDSASSRVTIRERSSVDH